MLHDILVDKYGLQSTKQMSSIESLALFLYMVGAPASNSQAADRFERSVFTVCNKFHHVLDCVDYMAGDYIRPNDPTFTEVHEKLQPDSSLISKMPLEQLMEHTFLSWLLRKRRYNTVTGKVTQVRM